VGTVAALFVAVFASAAVAAGTRITGFGATDAAWNRAHVADHTYLAGAAYDPDPSLPKVNGRTADRYYAVQHLSGHVLFYGYRFRGQSISQAKALVLRTEFPADTHVVWFRAVGSSCAQMLVRSATLAHALRTKAIGDRSGTALVEFSSGDAADHYSSRSVNDASVAVSEPVSRSNAPGC